MDLGFFEDILRSYFKVFGSCYCKQNGIFYTPGIYAKGDIAFAFPFVRSFVTFRHIRRIYLKVVG